MQVMPEQTVFIAGATSVHNLNALKKAFETTGFSVCFVDAPFMKPFLSSDETENIQFSAGIKCPGNSIIIPLSEYWISYCIENGNARISQNALSASRSKLFLYEMLGSKK